MAHMPWNRAPKLPNNYTREVIGLGPNYSPLGWMKIDMKNCMSLRKIEIETVIDTSKKLSISAKENTALVKVQSV